MRGIGANMGAQDVLNDVREYRERRKDQISAILADFDFIFTAKNNSDGNVTRRKRWCFKNAPYVSRVRIYWDKDCVEYIGTDMSWGIYFAQKLSEKYDDLINEVNMSVSMTDEGLYIDLPLAFLM